MTFLLILALSLNALSCARAASMNQTPDMMQYDTIVVGLGAAGTTAASTLAAAGKRVLALEAQDRIGGRVNTVPFGDGVVELGAEWIHGQFDGDKPSRTYDAALRNNVTVIPQDINMEVYMSDGSQANNSLINELLNFVLECTEDPPEKAEPLGQYLTRRLLDYIKEKHPSLLNDQSFITEFLNFADLVVDNYEATNSWNDITTDSKYEELGGHQHISWHRHGYKTFFEILLNTYNKGPGLPTLTIKLNTEVKKIEYSTEASKPVSVTTADGTVYKADNVIVTVSVGVLKERHDTLFSPKLPQIKISAIDHISMGVLDKVLFSFEKRWWRKEKWFVYFWRPEDKESVPKDDNWTTKVMTVSIPKGSTNAITVWTMGENAKHATLFTPKLPQSKITAIDKLSIGVMDKIIFLFPKQWVPSTASMFGFIWQAVDKKKISKEDEWVTKIFGVSKPMGCDHALTVWTSGETGKLVETLPEDLVKRKTMELLRKFMGATVDIPEPTAMLRSTWNSNPFTRGSYTYDNIESPKYPTARSDLAAPLTDSSGKPKVLFAGEATNPTHFSTVHGAADTGYREAMRLLPSSKI